MPEKPGSFRDQLKKKGYRLTNQRLAVLGAIKERQGDHLSPEDIYAIVRVDHPEIGIATIYRTLLLFCDMDLIYKLDMDEGFSRYELNEKKADHRHHHLICTRCGLISGVEDDLLESLEQQIHNKNGFIVKDHRVKFYGYCKECVEKTDLRNADKVAESE